MIDDDALPEVSEKDLDLVKDILRTITKTSKAFNVYPKDNPIYQKFVTELSGKFAAFFEDNDELSLDVGQYSLLFRGREVYQNEEKTENIALLLFADGIRQLNFYKGLTFEEISDFIDILRAAPKAGVNDEDDIVTLLWEKNIKNMGYTAAEDTVNEALVVEETFLADAFDTADVAGSEAGTVAAAAPPGFSFKHRSEPALTKEELQAVRNEVAAFDEKAALLSAADLFFDLLSGRESGEAFFDIVQNLGRVIDAQMRLKDIPGTIVTLNGLAKVREKYAGEPEMEAVGKIAQKAGSVENLKTLFAAADVAESRQYLLLLDHSSMPDMIQVLGELSDRKHRRLLCEVLSEFGKRNLEHFAKAVDDPRWYLVRNVAMVLGMTKGPASVQYLDKMLKHSDNRVRREAIRALDTIPSDETKKSFLSALTDDDVSVRTVAIRALRRFRSPEVLDAVKKMTTREELKKRSFDEKKTILETYATVAGEKAFIVLSDLFKKKGLIETDDNAELRAAAAYGLGIIGSQEACSLIEKETGSKKNALREACLRALKESRQSGIHRT